MGKLSSDHIDDLCNEIKGHTNWSYADTISAEDLRAEIDKGNVVVLFDEDVCGESECANCLAMKFVDDKGECVDCGDECCDECSTYGIGRGGQEGWLCSEKCIDQEKTKEFDRKEYGKGDKNGKKN